MLVFFFFNDPATTEIYTLSLHDALPISRWAIEHAHLLPRSGAGHMPLPPADVPPTRDESNLCWLPPWNTSRSPQRSEEHTSELQSRQYLVCRLLLEKKKHDLLTTCYRLQ